MSRAHSDEQDSPHTLPLCPRRQIRGFRGCGNSGRSRRGSREGLGLGFRTTLFTPVYCAPCRAGGRTVVDDTWCWGRCRGRGRGGLFVLDRTSECDRTALQRRKQRGPTLGIHSGLKSPPPNFDFTAMSSAISLLAVCRENGHRRKKERVERKDCRDRDRTYYWSCRRSSLSFPTSARRMRTSLARALLKSFRYLRNTYPDR